MILTDYPILSLATFLPACGAVLLLLIGSNRLARWFAFATTLATMCVLAPLYLYFEKGPNAEPLQFVDSAVWIPTWNITYRLGVDGISLPLILLTGVLSVLCVGASWTSIRKRETEFYASLLFAETAMIGLFAAANLFLFYIFWELMVVPMFLLIGVWGGPRRVYAAIKFLLFTLLGSVLMLVGMIALHNAYPEAGLDFRLLAKESIGPTFQTWVFLAFLAAFAVKVPMFPVHTWLPDAHTEAPTAGSVILAGILLKMGAYGLLRVSLPILPDAVHLFLKPMLIVSVVAIVYGAYVTLAQTDLKRLIAYSSVSHMGFVTLGIFTLNRNGIEGAILQMVNHGIISAALFLCVGMIYERTHTREIKDYGGIGKAAPVYSIFLALFCLAAAGFPGLNSFIGELLIIGGTFQAEFYWLGGLAIWGVALGTTYLIWLYYRVVMGELNPGLTGLKLELNVREILILTPLAVLAVCLGLHPEFVLSFLDVPVKELLLAVGGSS
jgi:NADH-quinone oxidoreductase subunit M